MTKGVIFLCYLQKESENYIHKQVKNTTSRECNWHHHKPNCGKNLITMPEVRIEGTRRRMKEDLSTNDRKTNF
jgi:hypothetical protein